MNILLSCVGKRGHIAEYFRPHLTEGEKIIGTSNTPWTTGFAACDIGVLLPPIDSDEYIPSVLNICRRHDVHGLLSFYDPDVLALSKHLSTLKVAGVTPMIPGEKAASIYYDKWATFHALRDGGVDVPDSTIDLEVALRSLSAGQFRFPLVVKPRTGFGSANIFVAHTELQLQAFFSYAPDMMIQEFVNGDAYNLDVLSDLSGQVLHVVPWRKLRMWLGETEHGITVEDPELIACGKRIAEIVGLVGPMDVELFRTEEGRMRVFDVNLRFGGGYPVSHLAGADFPGLIVDILRGRRPEPRIGDYEPNVCMLKALSVFGGPAESFLRRLRSSGA